jgi:hypothetical protein
MKRGTHNTANGTGHQASHVPLVENLEDRRLFAVAVALVAPDTLNFTGNAAADTLSIRDNGLGMIQGTITNAAGVPVAFGPFVNIRRVNIRMGGGDDVVTYEFTGDLVGGPLARRRVNVNLGGGDDTFKLNATTDIDLGPTARLEVNATGGPGLGRDDLGANYHGELDGGWKLNMNGGNADDHVLADVLFDQGSAGRFGARLIGGNQDDNIGVLVHKANPADPIIINAGASGGNQFDVITRTPLATNDATCEVVNVVP